MISGYVGNVCLKDFKNNANIEWTRPKAAA